MEKQSSGSKVCGRCSQSSNLRADTNRSISDKYFKQIKIQTIQLDEHSLIRDRVDQMMSTSRKNSHSSLYVESTKRHEDRQSPNDGRASLGEKSRLPQQDRFATPVLYPADEGNGTHSNAYGLSEDPEVRAR